MVRATLAVADRNITASHPFARLETFMNCNLSFRSKTALLIAVFSSLVSLTCLAAEPAKDDAKKDETKVIKPEDAKANDGKKVTVEFTVLASRELPSGVCFLNSGKNTSDPDNFTA